MPNDWFEFKRFRVEQRKAAFKVGTDACLLGAWADVERNKRILDVGTGSGVIALMLAQRSSALITGIDRDDQNAVQAHENFTASPWKDRLTALHASVQDFEANPLFEHIVCNPPFFHGSTVHSDERMHRSRHDDELPLHEMLSHAYRLSSDDGSFSMVYPMERLDETLVKAQTLGWSLHKLLRIKPNAKKAANRFLAEWKKTASSLQDDTLILYGADLSYTEATKALLAPFYLHL